MDRTQVYLTDERRGLGAVKEKIARLDEATLAKIL
jgi:prevent-host-death family protein